MPEPDVKTIHVLVLDDHNLFRRGIVRLLECEPGIQVTADSSSISEAMAAMAAQEVDVVLLDYDLGAERGSEFFVQMREHGLEARVLVVTAGVTDRQLRGLLEQGAAGMFLKADSPELLVEVIRRVASGEMYLRSEYANVLTAEFPEEPATEDKQLSTRERAVLRGVVDGLANKEIAAQLQISESSVKGALQQLFNKTGVRTRSQLVRIALERYRDLVV